MGAESSSHTRRSVLTAMAASGALRFSGSASAEGLSRGQAAAAPEEGLVRPFRVDVPQEAIVDLRRRIAATRWPDRETVNDSSQGVQLAPFKELMRYWA